MQTPNNSVIEALRKPISWLAAALVLCAKRLKLLGIPLICVFELVRAYHPPFVRRLVRDDTRLCFAGAAVPRLGHAFGAVVKPMPYLKSTVCFLQPFVCELL
jgi:hypothetical protein